MNHALAMFANVSKLGRKVLLPRSCLARYQSKKLENRSVELGQQNTRRADTFGKITKWSYQQATVKQEGFCNSLRPIAYVFLVQKKLICLWEIMLKVLEKCAFPYFFSQPRGQQEAFVS